MRLDDAAKAELEAIVMEAFGNGGSTAEKGARYERLLLDAEQAQRPWAAAILDKCRRQGLMADGRRRFQRLTEVPVSYNGEILSMPKALSRKVRRADGEIVHELRLLEFHTWDDVRDKVRAITTTVRGYEATLVGLVRLLELREKYPESSGPAEACRLAGTTIEAVISGEAAA